MGTFGNPLFGSIAIGKRKKREVNRELQILREKIIRTGRNQGETAMIRKAVDEAIDEIMSRRDIDQVDHDMKEIKEEIFIEIAKRLEKEKINAQNEIVQQPTTSATISTTSQKPIQAVQEAGFFNFIADQGPQAVGVGVASLTYAAMASLPYWLPALAVGKKRRKRSEYYPIPAAYNYAKYHHKK